MCRELPGKVPSLRDRKNAPRQEGLRLRTICVPVGDDIAGATALWTPNWRPFFVFRDDTYFGHGLRDCTSALSGLGPSYPLVEVVFPTIRQRGNGKSLSRRSKVVRTVFLCYVQAGNLCHGHGVWFSASKDNLIPGRKSTFARNGEIKSGASTGEKALHHFVRFESNAQLVAW